MLSPPNLIALPSNGNGKLPETLCECLGAHRNLQEAFDEELADQVWPAWDAGEFSRY